MRTLAFDCGPSYGQQSMPKERDEVLAGLSVVMWNKSSLVKAWLQATETHITVPAEQLQACT